MSTIGKYRHLSHCSTEAGRFLILAIDHRTNLLDALNKAAGRELSEVEFMAFKRGVIAASVGQVSAVLTDPAYGIGMAVAQRVLPGRVGLLAPLEVTDYRLHPGQRAVNFIPGWSVEKVKKAGGDGVKLLLPYHPEADNAEMKRAVVRQLVDECHLYDIPFFLEPIAYSLDPERILSDAELRQITVDMAGQFSAMGVDVLKLQFPMQGGDAPAWESACREVNEASRVPWAILSGGVDFATFARQARIACQCGASGVIVGRAVWNEAVEHFGQPTLAGFLQETVPDRLRELADICAQSATAWFERIPAPNFAPDWYQ